MAFQLRQVKDVESVKAEIKLRLSQVFDLGVTSRAKDLEDQRWSRQHVICGGYGYPAEILKSSAAVTSLQDALNFLDGFRDVQPVGETRAVKLTRYPISVIDTRVPKNAFTQFQEMQKMSTTLDLYIFNPAIRGNQDAKQKRETAVETFWRRSDEYFGRAHSGDPEECQLARKEVHTLLSDTLKLANFVIELYTIRRGLVVEAKRLMERGYELETPHDGRKSNLWKWRSGMTGSFNVNTSENGPAHMLDQGTFQPHSRNFKSPTTSVRRATWWFITNEGIVGKLWPVNKRTEFRYDEQQVKTKGNEDSEGYKLVLGGRDEIYIIGWTVLCEYIDKDGQVRTDKNGRPFTAWIEQSNASKSDTDGFLPHLLAIEVKSTSNIKCNLEVFFILEKEYHLVLY